MHVHVTLMEIQSRHVVQCLTIVDVPLVVHEGTAGGA